MMFQALKAAAQQQGGSPFTNDYRDACLASGAVGLWMLDETTGTTAVDQGSAGVDGTYRGDMATSAARGVRSAFNIPLAGVAVADSATSGSGFRGGVVEVPSNPAFSTEFQSPGGDISYEWVSVNDSGSTDSRYWFKHYNGGFNADQGPMAHLKEDNDNATSQVAINFQNNQGGNGAHSGSITRQSFGVETHNVLTISSGSSSYIRWYRNGVRVFSNYNANRAQINGDDAPIFIGNLSANAGNWPTFGIRGAIGGCAFYDYDLTQTDVTAHYNALLL